jgi:hypothetical protein
MVHRNRFVGAAEILAEITALHAEFHRPAGSATPQYFSRYYCDAAMLLDTDDGEAASVDFDLLKQLAEHRRYFSAQDGQATIRPGPALCGCYHPTPG